MQCFLFKEPTNRQQAPTSPVKKNKQNEDISNTSLTKAGSVIVPYCTAMYFPFLATVRFK